MPDAIQSLGTQKASAALAGALTVPLIGGPIRRITRTPAVEALAGLGIVWAGTAMLDGHAEAIALGAGVAVMADGVFRMFLKVEASQ